LFEEFDRKLILLFDYGKFRFKLLLPILAALSCCGYLFKSEECPFLSCFGTLHNIEVSLLATQRH